MIFKIKNIFKTIHKRKSVDALVAFLIINQEFLPNPIIVIFDNIELTIYPDLLKISPKILTNTITGMIERRKAYTIEKALQL